MCVCIQELKKDIVVFASKISFTASIPVHLLDIVVISVFVETPEKKMNFVISL